MSGHMELRNDSEVGGFYGNIFSSYHFICKQIRRIILTVILTDSSMNHSGAKHSEIAISSDQLEQVNRLL